MIRFISILILVSGVAAQEVILDFGEFDYVENSIDIIMTNNEDIILYYFLLSGNEITHAVPVLGHNQGIVLLTTIAGGVYAFGFSWAIPPSYGVLCTIYFVEQIDFELCMIEEVFETWGGIILNVQMPDCTYIDYPPLAISGDINHDGLLDILDLVITVNIILDSIDPTSEQMYLLDINEDEVIDILDIVAMVDLIMGN